ncbi:MAG: TonB-dependent receptor [Dysgonamonadaceae bacterium]|jgi:iron complex outermembrane receptor protein|nr:TonB-dependent receptor [Dysgonamonadaceae bacterium]
MKKFFLFVSCVVSSTLSFADDFEIDSIKTVNLQEVEVIAGRATAKTPVTYVNMNKEQIDEFNSGIDIPFLLTLTPSVIATSDAGAGVGYTGFRVRGTDANRINITSNGIPMNDAESHGVFWVNIPDFASSLQDLQVQRGVGTSTTGTGTFGAGVNMKTENVSLEPFGEINGGYGSFNTGKATFKLGTGKINNHWALDARLSSITSAGFIDRANVDLKSYFAQGAYFNENAWVKFIAFGGKEKTYHAWDGVPDNILFPTDGSKPNRTYNPSGYMGDDENGNPLYYDNQTDNYNQTHYQLSLLRILNPDLNFNVSLHYTRGLGYYEEYKSNRTLREYGLKNVEIGNSTIEKSDLVRQKHLDNHFGGMVFSLDYSKEKWNLSLGGGGNYYDGRHFGYVTWVKNYANDSNFFPGDEFYRSKGEKTDMNMYLKGNYQLSARLNFYGDVQFRHIDYRIKGKNDKWDESNNDMQALDYDEKFNFCNPKAGLYYQINEENNVYASFAIAQREPNRNNYTDAAKNEIPKSEQLQDYELGYKFQDRFLTFGANLYYMKYKDQLILNGKVNEIGEPLTSNIPDSYRAGIELIAGMRVTSWFDWTGNLTLSRNKIKDYTEYVDDWETGDKYANYIGTTSISYSPSLIANSLFSFKHKNWNVGLQSSWVGKQYLDNSGSDDRKLDPYFVNNLKLGYSFRLKGIKSMDIHLLINNILNEKYESNGYVWYSWYEGVGDARQRNNELRYFPQAGTHMMTHIAIRF